MERNVLAHYKDTYNSHYITSKEVCNWQSTNGNSLQTVPLFMEWCLQLNRTINVVNSSWVKRGKEIKIFSVSFNEINLYVASGSDARQVLEQRWRISHPHTWLLLSRRVYSTPLASKAATVRKTHQCKPQRLLSACL